MRGLSFEWLGPFIFYKQCTSLLTGHTFPAYNTIGRIIPHKNTKKKLPMMIIFGKTVNNNSKSSLYKSDRLKFGKTGVYGSVS